ASAEQLADELRRYLHGEPLIHTRPVGTAERLWRWCRRNRGLAMATGFAAAALVAVTALSVFFAIYVSGASVRLSEEQELTEAALQKSKRLTARLEFERGWSLCAQGDVLRGLHWLARSLRSAPANADALQHAIRVNLALRS